VLPFLVIGLTSGAVYALAGLGLVLTYKTSAVFNFAHGALATLAAYAFYSLFVLDHWPWPLAAGAAIAVGGPLMGWAFEILARRIRADPPVLRVAATVGVFVAVEAAIYLIYGTETVRTVPVFLGAATVRVAGASVQVAQLVTFCFVVVSTIALTAYLRWTRRGIAMRAVVDDPELLDLVGTSPVATRRTAWAIGVTLAAASGVLFAPLLPLDPLQLTLLVASAFGAAAIGAFRSLSLTVAGGLAIGVLSALCTKWFTGTSLLGISPAVPFIAVFVIVLLLPRRRLLEWPDTAAPASGLTRATLRDVGGAAIVFACLLLAPLFVGFRLADWTAFVATTIVFGSLGLLVRTAGQIVLCQVTFMAIGAAAFSHLALGGLPWLAALMLASLIAVPVGLILAVPATRLPPVYLALATFALSIVAQDVFYPASYMFGTTGLGLSEPAPHLSVFSLGDDQSFYYVVVAIAGVAALFVAVLTHGRLGRLLRNIAEAPAAVQTSGADIAITRLIAFAVAAYLAAMGGILAAVSHGTVAADSYPPVLSLTYLAAIVIAPAGAALSSVLAAAGLILIPSYFAGFQTLTALQLIFGVSVVLYALLPARLRRGPRPLQSPLPASLARGRSSRRVMPPTRAPGGAGYARSDRETKATGGLSVEDITARLGDLFVLDGTSLSVGSGRITGLIGPNGAGKSSVINVCSGLLRPARGRVMLGEIDLLRCRPSTRARLGVRRTFQRPRLFESLTLGQNVEAGAEACLAGSNPFRHLSSRRSDRRSVRDLSDGAIELVGLGPYVDVPVAELAPSQRRLVELARCLAAPCRMLLLDEPCSGLDRTEARRVGGVLRQVVSERGVGILLVEHDLTLALEVCQHLYVLDSGRIIFEGLARELIASELVRAIYMGDSLPDLPDIDSIGKLP
jgi:ABC-type branched-subunit amino acid transport system ATPase component/branched-subunit amino acid ABC-type transport system permease component